MRTISASTIADTIVRLCLQTNFVINDVYGSDLYEEGRQRYEQS